jgi:hypothetical protein
MVMARVALNDALGNQVVAGHRPAHLGVGRTPAQVPMPVQRRGGKQRQPAQRVQDAVTDPSVQVLWHRGHRPART